MTFLQLLIPVICSSILVFSTGLFFYIYFRFKDKIYLYVVLNGIFGLIFTLSDFFVTVSGELMNQVFMGLQFHRIEQLSGAFFLFSFPLLLSEMLNHGALWKNADRIISKAGLVFALMTAVIAFTYPDLFISQKHLHQGANITWHISRGEEGPLYLIRDILLFVLIIYSLISICLDLLKFKSWKRNIFFLPGLLLAFAGAVDDSINVYFGSYTGIFSNVFFSRVSAGITAFMIFVICGVLYEFMNEIKNVKKAYTEKEQALNTLSKNSERFNQLAENINEAFLIYDFPNDVFIYISPAYENIWGIKRKDLFESPVIWKEMIHPEDADIIIPKITTGPPEKEYELEYRIIRPDKTERWIRDRGFPISDSRGQIYRLAITHEDITDRKKNEEDLVYYAYYDALTGLLNRRSFCERLKDAIRHAGREKDNHKAILFIDLEEFKKINNNFGYEFGDMIIKQVAARLLICMRDSDYVFRISGNEFAVILNDIKDDLDSSRIAEKVINEISIPYNLKDRDVFLRCSIGISLFPKDSNDADALFKHANIALNEAKRHGGTYKYFDNDMNIKAQERFIIEHKLRYAVERDEFDIYYQPFIDNSGKITGMEALIRWKNPDMGFLMPDSFLPIAESSSQIIPIGSWVISTACRQTKKWIDAGFKGLRIAVNVSMAQLADAGFIDRISEALKQAGLSPENLELEITETSFMENPQDTINKVNTLCNMGIFLSIDDFGIDYSSLGYVSKFKIKTLKIDRTFIKNIIDNEVNKEITKAIISMAHNLNLKVIAEGVETIEQRRFLGSLECDEMQGFLFSRPLPAAEFEILLKNGISL